MPARIRSDRTSLSNCAKAASTPSISLPVEVSSIGSVADRNRPGNREATEPILFVAIAGRPSSPHIVVRGRDMLHQRANSGSNTMRRRVRVACAKRSSGSVEGRTLPPSIRAIDDCEVFILLASCDCDRPAAVRASISARARSNS